MSNYLFIPNNKKTIKTINVRGFNSFILPLKNYSIGFEKYFTVSEINNLSKKYEVSVILNKFLHKEDLEKVDIVLKKLKNVKYFFVEDLAYLSLLDKEKIVLNMNHIICNYSSVNFYNKIGYKNVVLSNELTLNELKEIKKSSKSKLFYFYINKNILLYSKRTLISNYFKNFKKLKFKNKLNLKENASKYELEILEEQNSSIIFNKEVFNASGKKNELNKIIDYLIINLNYLTKTELEKLKNNKYFGESRFLKEKIGYKVKGGEL